MTNELAVRDEYVFKEFVKNKIPVTWNLAGGYQREHDGRIDKVLAIHRNTAIETNRALAAWIR
jgi:hypothetical protein